MIGKWIIKIEGSAESGGTIGKYECSNCHRVAYASEFPQYFFDKDHHWNDPNFCPNCGSDNRNKDIVWSRLDVIVRNMEVLKENYEQYKKDIANGEDDYCFWQDEYGSDLTDMIDCHPVFSDSAPRLCEKRNCWDDQCEKDEACAECKALWLMEEYE